MKLKQHYIMLEHTIYIAETFEGENFRKFRGFLAIRKSFSAKFGGVASFSTAKARNPRKFSPQKMYFSLCKSVLP